MSPLERRVEVLEREADAIASVSVVWPMPGETEEQMLARLDPNARMKIVVQFVPSPNGTADA